MSVNRMIIARVMKVCREEHCGARVERACAGGRIEGDGAGRTYLRRRRFEIVAADDSRVDHVELG